MQDSTTTEIEEVKARYERRRIDPKFAKLYSAFSPFTHFQIAEREFWYSRFLAQNFGDMPIRDLTVLEIGAGSGGNIGYFRRLGIPSKNVFANELLEDRQVLLQNWLPDSQLHIGSILDLPVEKQYDVVFQSTVFSSILDANVRQVIADKMWEFVKPGGLVLWYDFFMNNPYNKDVRGVPIKETCGYFPAASRVWKKKVTLAPPIGRRVGRLYNFLNFPFLRTHCVAAFRK